MKPTPKTENNYLMLLNKASLDLVRAVEREKMRRIFNKTVSKDAQKWLQVIAMLKTNWPQRQGTYYKN
jgi:hypothetical protein